MSRRGGEVFMNTNFSILGATFKKKGTTLEKRDKARKKEQNSRKKIQNSQSSRIRGGGVAPLVATPGDEANIFIHGLIKLIQNMK